MENALYELENAFSWQMKMKKATVKWKIGFLRLENGKCLFLRPENGNSTPSCPPSKMLC